MPAVVEIRFEDEPPHVVELTESVITIGRSVDNVLEIPDPNMSRRHCVIEQRETGEVILTDCNSSNGTRVNEQPVLSQELGPGDVIGCGSTQIRFARTREELARHEPPPPPEPPPTFDEEITASQGEATLPRTAKRGPAKTQVAVLAHERDDLRKLLEITKQLNRVHELRVLLEKIIDAAIELLAAERGFLILLREGEMKIEISRTALKTTVPEAESQVSTQICRQVIDSGRPVLTTNAQTDDRFGRYKSVVGLQLRSILCVPFQIKQETFGTVYLDAGDVGAFSNRDVELLSAFGDQAALAINNARLLNAARRRSRIEQELRIASQIQAKLLPTSFPEIAGLRVYGSTHPAKEVGGDYFDFVIRRDDKALWFCIGDVTGKGVPAGMVMASARSVLRSLVDRVDDTRDLVVALNRFLCTDLEDEEIFLSFVLMRYDPVTGRLFYTGAGHENILIWREQERRVEVRKTGGMVLGLTARLEEAYREQELELGIGDALLLYTDGVSEAMDAQRNQFGIERLVASAERHLSQPPEVAAHSVLGDVLRFQSGSQRDDVTLVVVRRERGENDAPPVVGEDTRPGGYSRRQLDDGAPDRA